MYIYLIHGHWARGSYLIWSPAGGHDTSQIRSWQGERRLSYFYSVAPRKGPKEAEIGRKEKREKKTHDAEVDL